MTIKKNNKWRRIIAEKSGINALKRRKNYNSKRCFCENTLSDKYIDADYQAPLMAIPWEFSDAHADTWKN